MIEGKLDGPNSIDEIGPLKEDLSDRPLSFTSPSTLNSNPSIQNRFLISTFGIVEKYSVSWLLSVVQ